jgi:hypothetical protein
MGAAGKICSTAARHSRCRRGQVWSGGRVPKTTFVGTLISDMGFGTLSLQVVDLGPIMASGTVKGTVLELDLSSAFAIGIRVR